MDRLYTWLAAKYPYVSRCPLCEGAGWERCVTCHGRGEVYRVDLFERAVGWDLRRIEWPPSPWRYILGKLINPLVQVAVRRWDV